jgi:hypothetical protein
MAFHAPIFWPVRKAYWRLGSSLAGNINLDPFIRVALLVPAMLFHGKKYNPRVRN